jgi:hypothetical protein
VAPTHAAKAEQLAITHNQLAIGPHRENSLPLTTSRTLSPKTQENMRSIYLAMTHAGAA